MHHCPPLLVWHDTDTYADAHKYLHALFMQRTLTSDHPSPFLPTKHPPQNRLKRIPTAQRCTTGGAYDLLWFSDRSALIVQAPHKAVLPQAFTIPRAKTATPHASSAQAVLTLIERAGGHAGLLQALTAIWEDYAKQLPLAHPADTPQATTPPSGRSWSPFDVFPDTQMWVGADFAHTGAPGLEAHVQQAVMGAFLDIMPEMVGRQDYTIHLGQAIWQSPQPLRIWAMARHITISPQVVDLLLSAIPELGPAIGPGFWKTATPLTYPMTKAPLVLSVPNPLSAHTVMGAKTAWATRILPWATQWQDTLASIQDR